MKNSVWVHITISFLLISIILASALMFVVYNQNKTVHRYEVIMVSRLDAIPIAIKLDHITGDAWIWYDGRWNYITN